MKIIQKRSHTKRNILLASLVGILLIGGGFFVWQARQKPAAMAAETPSQSMNDINYNPPTNEEKEATEERKDEIIKEQEKEREEKETPPSTNNITVTIVRPSPGQTTQGEALNIRTVIDGTSSGTCNISLTKTGQPTITKTFPVVFDVSSATCENADIPLSDFGEEGEWQLSITVSKDGKQSQPVTRKVTIAK